VCWLASENCSSHFNIGPKLARRNHFRRLIRFGRPALPGMAANFAKLAELLRRGATARHRIGLGRLEPQRVALKRVAD
jgi:hypothetical protein